MSQIKSLYNHFRSWAFDNASLVVCGRPIVILKKKQQFNRQSRELIKCSNDVLSKDPNNGSYLLRIPTIIENTIRVDLWQSENYSSSRLQKPKLLRLYDKHIETTNNKTLKRHLEMEKEKVTVMENDFFSIRRSSGFDCRAGLHFQQKPLKRIYVPKIGLFILDKDNTVIIQTNNKIRKKRADKQSNCIINKSHLPLSGSYQIIACD